MTSSDQAQPAVTLPPELAQIAAEAEALNPPPVAGQEQAAAPAATVAPVNYQEEAEMIVGMLFEGCSSFYPSTQTILNQRQARFAAALGKVMEKRQWSLAAFLGRWGAEIELGFVAATMAIPVVKAIEHDRAAAKALEQKEAAAQRPADPQPPRPEGDPYAKFAEQQGQQ
ncbi:MAG TPA: hypothetical protein VK165_08025 [Azonexus sp.]|nr:hypothetical protein [Azonexus sp.]